MIKIYEHEYAICEDDSKSCVYMIDKDILDNVVCEQFINVNVIYYDSVSYTVCSVIRQCGNDLYFVANGCILRLKDFS